MRTGVTAILPHGGNLFQEKVAGAVFVGNAFGKLAGSTQVQELGTIESPIVLTNTLSVGTALDAIVRWTIAQPGNENVRSVNGLVGETNDGGLNDIRGLHVTRDHVTPRSPAPRSGAVEEGAVGAGTGTVAFGWKGRHRHVVAHGAQQGRSTDRWRARADQLRRQADHRWRAGVEVPPPAGALSPSDRGLAATARTARTLTRMGSSA